MYAKIHTGFVVGIDGKEAVVTCEINKGAVASFDVVGLPELAVRELRVRVRSAIRHAGLDFPGGTVQVAVDGVPPQVAFLQGFDLPIAVAILVASGQVPVTDGDAFIGELSLIGAVRSVPGVSCVVANARDKRWYVPKGNVRLAQAAGPYHKAISCESLQQVVQELLGNGSLVAVPEPPGTYSTAPKMCWSDVRGHEQAKRALEIAAAGGHNAVLCGSAGTGKTMLSRRLPTILPAMSDSEAAEVTALCDVAGLLPDYAGQVNQRPFRAPHHTCSAAALVGGGSIPRPGEVSLAHRGVLFLDELPEFPRHVIETLRQPLEDGYVTVTRARQAVRFPATALVVAALNPCPCGHQGADDGRCQCSPLALQRYRSRLSPQLLGSFDIQLRLQPPPTAALRNSPPGETSETVRARVTAARARQTARWNEGCTNASVSMSVLRQTCPLRPATHDLLLRALDAYNMSTWAHDRVWRVAQTLADMDGAEEIGVEHVGEALQYRYFDREENK